MTNGSFLSPRIMIPNASRRKSWHDYSRKAIYLVTLIRNDRTQPFSELTESIKPTDNGEIIREALSEWTETFPQIVILEKAVLPDYMHLLIHVKEADCELLPSVISALKERCAELKYKYTGANDENGANDTIDYEPLFCGGFDDRIIRRKSDFDHAVDYVRKAIGRYSFLSRPDCFSKRYRIFCTQNREFECTGNPFLLKETEITAVKVSSKYTPEELLERKKDWLRTIINGGVIVSPFISGKELRVRRWALENGGRVIQLLPNGFGESFTLPGEFARPMSEGRLLLVAPTTFDTERTRPSRSLCVEMNATASEIASRTFLKI